MRIIFVFKRMIFCYVFYLNKLLYILKHFNESMYIDTEKHCAVKLLKFFLLQSNIFRTSHPNF